jgi:hypothetical protein
MMFCNKIDQSVFHYMCLMWYQNQANRGNYNLFRAGPIPWVFRIVCPCVLTLCLSASLSQQPTREGHPSMLQSGGVAMRETCGGILARHFHASLDRENAPPGSLTPMRCDVRCDGVRPRLNSRLSNSSAPIPSLSRPPNMGWWREAVNYER